MSIKELNKRQRLFFQTVKPTPKTHHSYTSEKGGTANTRIVAWKNYVKYVAKYKEDYEFLKSLFE